jgi:hypothetical protein
MVELTENQQRATISNSITLSGFHSVFELEFIFEFEFEFEFELTLLPAGAEG